MVLTRIIARIASVALLSLTLLAGLASAECAWVLWNEISDVYPRQITSIRSWGVLAALETRTQCEDMLTRIWQDALDEENKPSPDRSETMKSVSSRRGLIDVTRRGQQGEFLGKTTNRFQCLPDTLDPRGPKGKDRIE